MWLLKPKRKELIVDPQAQVIHDQIHAINQAFTPFQGVLATAVQQLGPIEAAAPLLAAIATLQAGVSPSVQYFAGADAAVVAMGDA